MYFPLRKYMTSPRAANRARPAAGPESPAPLPEQATIGDSRVPRHGLSAVGALDFDLLSPAQHSTRTARS